MLQDMLTLLALLATLHVFILTTTTAFSPPAAFLFPHLCVSHFCPSSFRPPTKTTLRSFDGFSDLDDNELIPAPLPPTTNPRLASGFRFPPYNCAAGETVTYDEESIQGILSACRIDIPTLFGYTDDNLAVGITGSVDLVELDGPVVVLTLGGRFWHQRPTVLMRVKAYLQERCPEIVDVVVGDEWELTDEANV